MIPRLVQRHAKPRGAARMRAARTRGIASRALQDLTP